MFGWRPGSDKDPVDPARLLCELVPSGCPEPPAEDGVALATVQVLEGRHLGDVDECAVRTRIFSQRVLVELITCLMTKVAECCHQPTLRVDTVAVFTAEGQDLALVAPAAPIVIPAGLHGQGFQTRFSRGVAPASVTTVDESTTPDQATVLVVRRDPAGPGTPVPGLVSLPAPDLVRWELPDAPFQVGTTYDVTIFGDPTAGRPTIQAGDDAERLDGNPVGLPSGDGTEGGDFTFVITCEAMPDTGLKVARVQMSTSAAAGPVLQDPGSPIQVPVSAKPTGFRVTFTEDGIVAGRDGERGIGSRGRGPDRAAGDLPLRARHVERRLIIEGNQGQGLEIPNRWRPGRNFPPQVLREVHAESLVVERPRGKCRRRVFG